MCEERSCEKHYVEFKHKIKFNGGIAKKKKIPMWPISFPYTNLFLPLIIQGATVTKSTQK